MDNPRFMSPSFTQGIAIAGLVLVAVVCLDKVCLGQGVECGTLLRTKTVTDPGSNTIKAKHNVIISNDEKTGFAVLLALIDSTVLLSVNTVGGSPCVDQGDMLAFVFSDSSRFQLQNMGESNCEAQSLLYLGSALDNEDKLDILSQKQITHLTVWAKGKPFSRKVNPEAASSITNMLTCLKSIRGARYVIVERQPEYQGGMEAMMKFINSNLRRPPVMKKNKELHGVVNVEFIITEDGSIADVKTVRGIHPDLDAEAERVVRMMPPWRPGSQQGKPVRVKFNIPVRFK